MTSKKNSSQPDRSNVAKIQQDSHFWNNHWPPYVNLAQGLI